MLLTAALAACIPAAAPEPAGDAVRGRALFNGDVPLADGYPAGCANCHSLEPGARLYCPSLQGVADRAPTRIRDAQYRGTATDAAGYFRESILYPSVYIVPDLPNYGHPGASEMPPGFGSRMSEKDLDDLVAFLSTLR